MCDNTKIVLGSSRIGSLERKSLYTSVCAIMCWIFFELAVKGARAIRFHNSSNNYSTLCYLAGVCSLYNLHNQGSLVLLE